MSHVQKLPGELWHSIHAYTGNRTLMYVCRRLYENLIPNAAYIQLLPKNKRKRGEPWVRRAIVVQPSVSDLLLCFPVFQSFIRLRDLVLPPDSRLDCLRVVMGCSKYRESLHTLWKKDQFDSVRIRFTEPQMMRTVMRSMGIHLQTVVYLKIRVAPWVLRQEKLTRVFSVVRGMKSLQHLSIVSADQWMRLRDLPQAAARLPPLQTLELYLGMVAISQLAGLVVGATVDRVILHTNCSPCNIWPFSEFRKQVRDFLVQVVRHPLTTITWYNSFPLVTDDYNGIHRAFGEITNLRCITTSCNRPGFIYTPPMEREQLQIFMGELYSANMGVYEEWQLAASDEYWQQKNNPF
jgi:hypothetical protein